MDLGRFNFGKKTWFGICLIAIFFVFIIVFFWIIKNKNMSLDDLTRTVSKKENYVIPGVPYYGAQNYLKGCGSPSCNSVAAIMEYWNPGGVDASEIDGKFSNGGTASGIISFFSQKGFSAQEVKLTTDDFSKYINPEEKTPLLLFLPLNVSQPDVLGYYPATILIGVDENSHMLTFHNYWLGNNYELSYDAFNQLESKLSPDRRNSFVVIQPSNLSDKLKEVAERKIANYPPKTSVVQNGGQLFVDYGIGVFAYNRKMYDVAIEYFSKVENSSAFNDYFPPYYKTMLYYRAGEAYYGKDDLNNALLYAQKSVAGDYGFNQPFKDWRGTRPWSKLSGPYSFLGDIYRQKKDFQKAKESYSKALKIAPNNNRAKKGMDILNASVESTK